jgi:hypothetical protein
MATQQLHSGWSGEQKVQNKFKFKTNSNSTQIQILDTRHKLQGFKLQFEAPTYTQFIYSNRDVYIDITLCSSLLHSAIAIYIHIAIWQSRQVSCQLDNIEGTTCPRTYMVYIP